MKWSATFAASHLCLTVIKRQQVRWYRPKCISTARLVTGAAHNTGWRIMLAESTLCWSQHLSDGRRWKCCMCVFVCVRCMHESVYVNILEFGSQFTNCESGNAPVCPDMQLSLTHISLFLPVTRQFLWVLLGSHQRGKTSSKLVYQYFLHIFQPDWMLLK